MTTATITGPIYSVSQVYDFISMSIVFELSRWDQEENVGLYASGPVIVPVDENGEFSVNLFVNSEGTQETHYQCFLQYRRTDGTEWIREPIGIFTLTSAGTFALSDLEITPLEQKVISTLDVHSLAKQYLTEGNQAYLLSQAWAESSTEPGDPGTKSSKTWAGVSEGYADDAATSAANAALFDGPKFDTVSEMGAYDTATDDVTAVVWSAFNAQPETFTYDSDSELTADGALVVDATGMGVGRWISKRTNFANPAELLSDVRTHAVGTAITAESEKAGTLRYEALVLGDPSTAPETAAGQRMKPVGIVTPFHWDTVEEPEGTFGGDDQASKLQDFFDFLAVNDVVAHASGVFRFDTPLKLTSDTEVACKLITGDLFLRAGVQFDEYGLYLHRNHPDAYWFDNLHVQLLGGSDISLRETPVAIKYGQTGRLSGGTYTGENALMFAHYEDTLDGNSNSNLMNIRKFVGKKCGSGHDAAGGTHEGSAYGIIHYGNTGSKSQATRISPYLPADMPPLGVEYCGEFSTDDPFTSEYNFDQNGIWIEILGRVHQVVHIDRDASAFWVYPQLDHSIPHATGVGTAFRWIYGGARMARSGDSNVSQASVVEAVNCGQGNVDIQLYGTSIDKILCDDVGIAMVFGSGGYHVGSNIGSYYLESCRFHILTGTENCTFHVGEGTGLSLEKVITTVNPSDASGLATWATPALQGGSVVIDGVTYRGVRAARNTPLSTIAYDPTKAAPGIPFYANNLTFTLDIQAGGNDATGIDGGQIVVMGSGSGNSPTTVTFRPPIGHSINGGTARVADVEGVPDDGGDEEFTTFTAPGYFAIHYDVSADDWIVVRQ